MNEDPKTVDSSYTARTVKGIYQWNGDNYVKY